MLPLKLFRSELAAWLFTGFAALNLYFIKGLVDELHENTKTTQKILQDVAVIKSKLNIAYDLEFSGDAQLCNTLFLNPLLLYRIPLCNHSV
jgi:hypothetical protein